MLSKAKIKKYIVSLVIGRELIGSAEKGANLLKQMNPIQMTQSRTAATTDRATIRLTDNTERENKIGV